MISIQGQFSDMPVFAWTTASPSRRSKAMSLETKIETTRCVEESEIPKKEIAAKFERLPNSVNTILKNNSEIMKNFETSDLNLMQQKMTSVQETQQCG